MLITTDLRTRLTRAFFTNLVSQLKSARKPAPIATTIWRYAQPATSLNVTFAANNAHYGRPYADGGASDIKLLLPLKGTRAGGMEWGCAASRSQAAIPSTVN